MPNSPRNVLLIARREYLEQIRGRAFLFSTVLLPLLIVGGMAASYFFGRKAGTRSDFTKYSDGMKGASAKGLVWTDDKIFEYLADPKAYLTKVNGADAKAAMVFTLKDEQKRKDVINFLKAIKDQPACN